MNYFVTIGIEIHCELKTNTKMFSGAPVRFGEIANTCTSVVGYTFICAQRRGRPSYIIEGSETGCLQACTIL